MWSFTTAFAPDVPALATPSNGATGQSLMPTLTWTAASNASLYRLQVSTSAGFSTMIFDDSTITAISRQVGTTSNPLSSNTTYYWRVRSANNVGESQWSSVWNFTTGTPPPAPVLASPSNGATGVATQPTLSWNASSGATSYVVQVSTQSSFSTIAQSYTVSTTSKQLATLNGGVTYYWRVNASNSVWSSSWSNVWSFTTLSTPVPSAPVLASPVNGALQQPTYLTLQ